MPNIEQHKAELLAQSLASKAVVKTEEVWSDDYKGSSADLVAAGLVTMDQLPGQPGRAKATASYSADGTHVQRGCCRMGARQTGYVYIRRAGKDRYLVSIRVSPEIGKRRLEEWERVEGLRRSVRQSEAVDANDAGAAALIGLLGARLLALGLERRKTVAQVFARFALDPGNHDEQAEITRVLARDDPPKSPELRRVPYLRLVQ